MASAYWVPDILQRVRDRLLTIRCRTSRVAGVGALLASVLHNRSSCGPAQSHRGASSVKGAPTKFRRSSKASIEEFATVGSITGVCAEHASGDLNSRAP